jgi:hypothetical protein
VFLAVNPAADIRYGGFCLIPLGAPKLAINLIVRASARLNGSLALVFCDRPHFSLLSFKNRRKLRLLLPIEVQNLRQCLRFLPSWIWRLFLGGRAMTEGGGGL